MKQDAFSFPPHSPCGSSYYNGMQLSSGNRGLLLCGRPGGTKPPSIPEGAIAKIRGIREKLHVRCQATVGFKQEAGARPLREECLPPSEVSFGLTVESDMVVGWAHCGAEINYTPQIYSTRGDNFARECQFANKREELALGTGAFPLKVGYGQLELFFTLQSD